jgi:hypothetical protein
LTRERGTGNREPEARTSDSVTTALQAYADRGVFRGFRATPIARGRIEYQFLWLTKRPVTAVFAPAAKRLAFPALLPQLDRDAIGAMKALILSRTSRNQPEHKRIDARRSRLTGTVLKGDFSLAVVIRGQNEEYAVSRVLNVINEIFVTLHEHYPEYLVERFGISPE